ncbi:FAD-dependent oxidoreductase [Brucella tritici]|uniref:FAD-dependent oxidoreductase n=1 Tax=Brucella tritici TaxID=94626 RepID=A0A6L3YBW1_9HYPH|nr:FAD-dependent oxidoreductase [Brucella tritici]KAB2675792.1 FAD-dependent oxidoreductase [Brucella tritici]
MSDIQADLFPHVTTPLVIRGKILRNRVYQPAHQPGLADGGMPGDRYIEYQRQRAEAGLGMQITGATPVLYSEVWANGISLINVDDRIVPGYKSLAQAVQGEGGLMLAQLAHVGAMETSGDHIVSASWGHSELTQQFSREITEEEIERLVKLFAASAARCRDGGLDGVEVSMAHGMLLASFLSPLMNRRDDRFGGDVEGKTRFPIMVLEAVREALGQDRILGIRMPGDELVDGGMRIDDAVPIAVILAETGLIDYISVTAGNNTKKLARADHWPPTPAPFGAFRHLSRAIKQAVNIPVATVGRVTTIELAEEIIASGDADLVGMVRANVADPQILPKSLRGRQDWVRPCVGANVCINALLDHKALRCMVNPDIGISKNVIDKRITTFGRAVVVGAGPAGLEAARRLTLAGFNTKIIERSADIGGQLLLWSATPSRIEFQKIIAWWHSELIRLGITLEVGREATVEAIRKSSPDLVVIATGSRPVAAKIETIDASIHQFGVYDVPLSGGHVLVRDEIGKLAAMLTAERLAETWNKVTLVTSALNPGEGEGLTTAYPLLRTLAQKGVEIIDRAYVRKLLNRKAVLSGVFGECRPPIEDIDAVVSITGMVSDNSLQHQLLCQGIESVCIGDALLPRDVRASVIDAASIVWTMS